jgi:hypothetical protein
MITINFIYGIHFGKNTLREFGTAFCVANKTLLTKVFQCGLRPATHHFQVLSGGNLSSSFEVTGVEGFQRLTSGNTTYTGKCYGDNCLRIAVACVTSVPIGQALWIHAKG